MNRKQINKVLNLFPLSSLYIGSPKYADTTKGHLKNKLQENIQYFKIEHTGYLDKIPSFYSKIKLVKEYQSYVATLQNARVWGRNGAVITSNDTFLEDVSYEFGGNNKKDHSIFFTNKQKKVIEYPGLGAVISHPGAYVYYHWMVDILPRIGLLNEFCNLEDIEFLVCDYSELSFQKESFELLGIKTEKIIRCNDNWNFHARFKQLVLPSLAGYHDQPNLFQINFLRKLFKDNVSDEVPFRKIYLSRKNTGRRHIVNESTIIDEIANYGFETIYCEDLNIAQQVKLFSESSIIIGPHGSAFTNIVFCKEQTIIIDIVNKSQINPCFWIISNLCSLKYYNIFGDSVAIDENYKNDNILIDAKAFKIFFEELNI